jgi:SnoaL-like domain
MGDFQDTVARYIASFNETDAGRRRELLGALYTDDVRYTDPAHDLAGPSAIDEFISSTQERFPGYEFSLGSAVDAHHDQARFQWHATAPGSTEPAYVGFDVLVTDNGRVRNVYGFLDKAPSA